MKYIQRYLKALDKAKTRKEKIALLDKLYADGFSDGVNSKD